MTNRIDGMGSGSIGASNGGGPIEQVRPSAAAGTATNAPQPGVDNVNITDSARRMLALAQAVQAAPEVNTQRVAELQQSISNGQYQVQPGRIADQMLKMEQDLAAAR